MQGVYLGDLSQRYVCHRAHSVADAAATQPAAQWY